MKLLFKQRIFSWLDSYDIYYEDGRTAYTVKGQLSWGHKFKIFDTSDNEVGEVHQVIFSFLPRFEIYMNGDLVGTISKGWSFLKPKYDIDFKGWQIQGNFFEWDYNITDYSGRSIACVSKELFNWSDTYSIDVVDPENALPALMFVLAVDAEKCSRNN